MKNNLKFTILSMGILFFTAGAVNAQQTTSQDKSQHEQKWTPEQRADKRSQLLKDKLKLDDNQTAKVRESILQFEKQRTKSADGMKKDHESLDASLNSVFTPEQQKQYKEMEDQRKAHMQERMHDKKEKNSDSKE